jgi:hypothetical protein
MNEDRPSVEFSLNDRLLTRQLEIALSHHFHSACLDRGLEILLSRSRWYITYRNGVSILAIECPDVKTCWAILESIGTIGTVLEDLVIARIRIYPPTDEGIPLELRVDEMDIIRGVFNPVEDFWLG